MTHILIVTTGMPEQTIVHISGHKSTAAALRKADAISAKTKVDLFGTVYEAARAPIAWQYVTSIAL